MWMDHQWLQAAANYYNININILTTGLETKRWTKLQPAPKPNASKASTTIYGSEMYLLHANDSNFDLLVPKLFKTMEKAGQKNQNNAKIKSRSFQLV